MCTCTLFQIHFGFLFTLMKKKKSQKFVQSNNIKNIQWNAKRKMFTIHDGIYFADNRHP